jgi:calcineurin-like phosphoesterase family protein
MLSFVELNRIWAKALRDHAVTVLQGESRPYRAIGDKSLRFLEELWKTRKAQLPDVGAMIEAGKCVRWWSDPHFGHDRIRAMCERVEFADVDAMNATIWDNVATAAGHSDLVICLGDLSYRNPAATPLDVQRRLMREFGGNQITLPGNHDAKGQARPEAWTSAGACSALAFALPLELLRDWCEADYGELADIVDWKALPNHINFGCAHWPVPPSRMPGPGWICLHGHIHNRPSRPLRINCSVEAIGYVPKTLRELLTAETMDDLVRRQHGLDGFSDLEEKVPGDAEGL